MATYLELLDASGNDALRQKVLVACVVAADKIRAETPPPNSATRKRWAGFVLANPEQAAAQMVRAVVAQNRAATLAAIIGATDAQIQTAVDSAVDLLADLTA